ncbi:MAG: ABC transporter permease subunit, partial [Nitrospinae bacterium]|nr:ABC transporter permease subunit [Nitrospinota bacterium]
VSEPPLFGLWPLAVGTFKITLVAVTLGMTLSLFAALAMAFYLPPRLRYAAKVITELLAGIPTVALGFLGLMFFATELQEITGSLYRLNAFLAGAVLSLTVIPILTTLLEEIFTAYPRDQIYAARCCGLFNYQIITGIVLPATWGKALAAALLGFGRCFGETMIVLMLSGNAAVADAGLFSGARAFSATIGAEMAEVVAGGVHYSALFLLGLLLIIVTFTVNYLSQALIRRWTYA